MKLSTKSRYGLRAVYYLAQNYGREMQNLATISKATHQTEPYLEKLLGLLRKGGIVMTVRGQAGGYSLSDEPKNISVGSVLRALEDDLVIADCVVHKCDAADCPNRFVFTKLYNEINNTLDRITVQDMLEENGKE